MKVIAFLKRVPDTGVIPKLREDGLDIVRDETLNYVNNPYDEFAVEEAIRIKEKHGGEVVVVGIGDERATEGLRTALAMGADRAVLIPREDFYDLPPILSARALAAFCEKEGFDLILAGKQAVDDDQAQVAAMVADLLGIPQATYVVKLEIQDGKALVERELEEGIERLALPLPAVVTAERGLNEPRYPSLRGIMQAKRKPIERFEYDFGENTYFKKQKLAYPPPKPPGKIIDLPFPDNVKELVRLLREEAKVL